MFLPPCHAYSSVTDNLIIFNLLVQFIIIRYDLILWIFVTILDFFKGGKQLLIHTDVF